jgi:hypothetical protein
MTNAFAAGRWKAKWIWAAGRMAGGHSVALRTTLSLDGVPSTVPARLSAVSRYTLYVNGVEVSRGPVRSNPRRQPYDVVDLAPFLHDGDNVIGAVAWRYDGATAWWMPPAEANDLRHGAFVFEARVGDTWIVTDGSWTATLLDGWTTGQGSGVRGRCTELIDARSLPAGWNDGSVDPPWPEAKTRRGRGANDSNTAHPPSSAVGPFGARSIAQQEGGLVEIDGGRVVVGSVVLDAEIPAGEKVTVLVSELVASGTADGRDNDTSVAFVGDGTRRVLESFDLYGGRGVTVEAPATATVHSVRIRERLYPVGGEAFFESSDPRLDAIYAVGRRTVTICSMDSYIDCPTREQRAWTGDSVVHQMVDLTTNTDWRLARWHPTLTASPRADGMLPMAVAGDIELSDFNVIPDWALHWIHSVHNLQLYIGDRDEIRRLLPIVEGVIRWFDSFLDEHGCAVDVPGWVLIDWAWLDTQGVSGALNGLLARSLLEFAEMAGWLRDEGRAEWAGQRHAELAAGFERLWDPELAVYVDSYAGGERRITISQHTLAAAIVGGVVPTHRLDRLVDVLTNEDRLIHAVFDKADGPAEPNAEIAVGTYLRLPSLFEPWWDVKRDVVRAQPFYRYVVHDAIAQAGRADLIPEQLLDWDRWAMKRCSTSWTECWQGGTVSHGWSSTPTRDLVQRVLGITPAEPGFAVAHVAPNLGTLDWARGAAPTPAGLITVDARTDKVSVDSPIPFVFAAHRYEAGSHTLARQT